MTKTILVTGGAGFIGSNFIKYMLANHDYHIINLDALTYAGNLENLAEIEQDSRYRFIKGDITDRKVVDELVSAGVSVIINSAAESHVDRSIEDPETFVRTNVAGTLTLLEAAKKHGIEKFIQISTDEVYGSLGPEGYSTEESPLAPNSPYSASKAGGDLLARAYYETYRLPVCITRCSNNYGPNQFPEKLIPLMISNALEDRPLPVYGDGLNVRDWLHVQDNCAAIDLVLHKGRIGQIYNIKGHNERTNIDIVRLILEVLGKPDSLITYVKDRPGHDRRYAIDATKISKELGWKPKYCFETGIRETIQWYLDNQEWLGKVRSGAYQEYYEKMYGEWK